ncbi:RICIN domain-containing protein [Alphaproteobacteria bacterium KMM 3653]|uniref:RICIN domain-containing protein n=1 Tax=Harenicola maris TaxID=2841044 RepID=A0AAP2CLG3_9RHOB|nr:RICIN domain-containing protein [Harenicola maris]
MRHSLSLAAAFSALLPAGAAMAENVEIYLLDRLDNKQNGYCLDIARAQGANANPDDGLQGHTCYSPLGELMVDQIFDTEKFAEDTLYMPEFDVCAEMAGLEAGSAVNLAACTGAEMQSFAFTGDGTITPTAAPDMCLTLAADTRSGRSDANQIKVLSLESCSDDLAPFQTWSNRSLN